MEKTAAAGSPTRWSAATKGRRRRVGATKLLFFLNFFGPYSISRPLLISNTKNPKGKATTLDLTQTEKEKKLNYLVVLESVQ